MDFWPIISIALLFFMLIGIPLLYSGTVRYKNSLSTLCTSFVLLPIIYFLWKFLGISLIYSKDIFNLSTQLSPNYLLGVKSQSYLLFQFLFALISTLLLWGSSLERVSLKFIIIFSIFWFLMVYVPVARWIVNKEGWLNQINVIDFAGGYTVHMTSGFSAMILSVLIGRRKDYFSLKNKHDQSYIYLATFFIFIGWIGFNCGSTIIFNEQSIISLENTIIAGITSLFFWCLVDILHTPNRVSMIGISLGLVSGLVAITPGAGLVSSTSAFIIGISSGVICNFSARLMHKVFKVDDVTEIFSSHGIGGAIGALLTGLFLDNFKANFIATICVLLFSVLMSYILFKVLNTFVTARITEEEESEGLDIKYFGEKISNN